MGLKINDAEMADDSETEAKVRNHLKEILNDLFQVAAVDDDIAQLNYYLSKVESSKQSVLNVIYQDNVLSEFSENILNHYSSHKNLSESLMDKVDIYDTKISSLSSELTEKISNKKNEISSKDWTFDWARKLEFILPTVISIGLLVLGSIWHLTA